MAQNQTPLGGVPFPSFVHVTDTAQRPTLGALLNAVGEVDASPSITGVAATGGAGTATVRLSPGTLTGVGGTGGTGVLTVEVDVAITGVAGTSAVGTAIPEVDSTLSGVAGTGDVGTVTTLSGTLVVVSGLEADAAIGDVVPEIDFTLTGLESTAAIGTPIPQTPILVDITGQEATAALGTPVWEIDFYVTGLEATASLGTVDATTYPVIYGQQVTVSIGLPFAISQPIRTNAVITAVPITASIGQPYGSVNPHVSGVHATAGLGAISTFQYQYGFVLSHINVTTNPPKTTDRNVYLRWSDTAGASWSQAIGSDLGTQGQYEKSIVFQRLGLGRSRCWELSWSGNLETCLQGAWVNAIPSKS